MVLTEEVIAALVTIKGIGRWSAEMFLIFRLLRPDVLPVGDLGILTAVQKAYRVPDSIWGKTKRVSFLVGPDGKVARVFPDVDPGVHAKELLGIIATLKGAK